jgi:hypothetical protein
MVVTSPSSLPPLVFALICVNGVVVTLVESLGGAG